MATALFVVYLVFSLFVLYQGLKPTFWEVGSAFYLLAATFIVGMPWFCVLLLWLLIIAIIVVVRVEAVRLAISDHIYHYASKRIPRLSSTEEEALNAGDTWLEQDIFTGSPDWQRLHHCHSELTKEEQAFLDNETQQLCSLVDEWEIAQQQDLPKKAWDYIKEKGFLGLVIAKEYGGKGFSARAHSDIVMKIASRSGVAAVTVMVPNSLGPGELLQHYGTTEQKNYYLPRLAKGQDIPCFALTEPGAGSDATSIQSEAVVIYKTIEGKKTLGLNLTLDKRWITLAPVATLIGLAVDLKDPQGLLAGCGREGITCLLISRDIPGLSIGNRHLPASQPFMNGTIRGKDLFVPITSIIGGQEKAGQGWQMLVECLSIGRSISLPALAAASSSVSYITTGAFARIRRQFSVEIAQFEGIEEILAEMAGLNYLINATRLLTVVAVNEHKKPSVASAITKYANTELARIVINGAMDIHAGRAVVVGPRNYMTNFYQGIPISVTVEGANIMSRNLLIFGQGSMACHPYLREEFYALQREDKEAFHTLVWQHIFYFVRNTAKMIGSAWTGGLFITTPSGALKRQYKLLARLSHAYAWLADLSLMCLGGQLKRKERLSARLADGMSYLYMAMAALRLANENKNDPAHQVHARWATTYCYHKAQHALIAFCHNFPSKTLGLMMRLLAFPFGQTMRYPHDTLDAALSRTMLENNGYRNELKKAIYLSNDSNQPVDRMEMALQALIKNDALYNKIGSLKRYKFAALKEKLKEQVDKNQLSQQEMDALLSVESLRWDAIQVDEFAFESMKKQTFSSITEDYSSPLE